jgi:hypothetical protein
VTFAFLSQWPVTTEFLKGVAVFSMNIRYFSIANDQESASSSRIIIGFQCCKIRPEMERMWRHLAEISKSDRRVPIGFLLMFHIHHSSYSCCSQVINDFQLNNIKSEVETALMRRYTATTNYEFLLVCTRITLMTFPSVT